MTVQEQLLGKPGSKKRRRTEGIDWQGLDFRVSNTGEIITETYPIDDRGRTDYRAQAGERAAYVRQNPIDYYVGDIIDGMQYDAADRLYQAFVKSQKPNPIFTGVFIDNAGPRAVQDSMIAAFDEVKSALLFIADENREVVHRIVIGRGQGPETIDAVRRRFSISQERCKAMLRAGLDDVARFYGIKKAG